MRSTSMVLCRQPFSLKKGAPEPRTEHRQWTAGGAESAESHHEDTRI